MFSLFGYVLGFGIAAIIVTRIYHLIQGARYQANREEIDKLNRELHTIKEANKQKEQDYETAKKGFLDYFSKFIGRK